MDSPKVTVLMSVYNGEKYLKEAIESILTQTFRDFEFIIINDGSTDGTSNILARYQQMDDRIRVYHQENRGLIASLNRGCQLAKGMYIARMDADDVSLPERFARQVQFLDAHPEIGVLGTWMELINENSIPQNKVRTPTTPGLIRWYLLFGCCMVHPSVMMRRDIVEQLDFYRPEALHSEDYDLWARASPVTKLANVPETLLRYRVCGERVSSRHSRTQEQNTIKTMHFLIVQLLNSEIPIELIANLLKVISGRSGVSLGQIESSVSLIKQLYRAYLNTNSLSRMESKKVAQDAAIKLYVSAALASRVSMTKALVLFVQAMKLRPPPLSIGAIKKGIKVLVGKA